MLCKIAWRNLWRNRRRTQLTMGAMIFACATLVFSLGYYDGMLWNMINNATARENGHISLARPGYIDSPALGDTITEAATIKLIKAANIVHKGMCPRINAYALVSCGGGDDNRTQPAQVMGVDYQAESASSQLAADVYSGSFLSGRKGEILLGKGLARKIRATPGSEIVFFSSAADGSMASALFHVKGIFSSGDNLRDSGLAIVNIEELRLLMALEGQIHSIRIFLSNPMQAEEIAASLSGQPAKIEARTWQSHFPQLAGLLKIWFNVQLFTSAIYYAALALITFNTMYMAFLERIHEFAVMQAIGLTRVRLAGLILAESLMLASLSGLAGTIVGTLLNFSLYYYPIDLTRWIDNIAWGGTQLKAEIFCVPSITTVFLPMLTMVLLGILVAAFPSMRLYYLKPVEALRES
ncbi:MAG: hypothetical protein PHD82_16360, partial [Candidatus Riflebacteria bacterium]|nr:hypothetical protein [Candidatus Riflebacteria bacterium]